MVLGQNYAILNNKSQLGKVKRHSLYLDCVITLISSLTDFPTYCDLHPKPPLHVHGGGAGVQCSLFH